MRPLTTCLPTFAYGCYSFETVFFAMGSQFFLAITGMHDCCGHDLIKIDPRSSYTQFLTSPLIQAVGSNEGGNEKNDRADDNRRRRDVTSWNPDSCAWRI